MAAKSSPIKVEADLDDNQTVAQVAPNHLAPSEIQLLSQCHSQRSTPNHQRKRAEKTSHPSGISKKRLPPKPRSRNQILARTERRVLRSSTVDQVDHTVRISQGNGTQTAGSRLLPTPPPKAIVIGIDFGTTTSAFSYHITPIDEPNIIAHPNDVNAITSWPGDSVGCGHNRQVPSELWLSETPRAHNQVRVGGSQSSDSEEEESAGSDSEKEVTPRSRAPPGPIDSDDDEGDALVESELISTNLFGYEVQYERYDGGNKRNDLLRFERIKAFLFDSSQDASNDKDPIRSRLNHCIRNGLLTNSGEMEELCDILPVLVELMTEYFKHIKKQLREHEAFTDAWRVSFVLAVPISCWPKTSSWILTDAVKAAIKATGLGALTHGSIEDLVFVLEPEAAGYFCLRKRANMKPGDTFIVVDGGGGTVDLMTFTIEDSYPLRLKDGGWKPLGDNCGASYLNLNFAQRLRDRLRDEPIFKYKDKYLERVINQQVLNFETRTKRNIDITEPGALTKCLTIYGLKHDEAKRFKNDEIVFNREDWEIIFMPQLKCTARLLRKQFKAASSTRGANGRPLRVDKVCAVGGFCASPSLQSFLRETVKRFREEFTLGYDVELVTTTAHESVSTVASGAVHQHSERRDAPRRAPSSFGFMRTALCQSDVEDYEDNDLFQHDVDGKLYFRNIDYFIQKERETIVPNQTFEAFRTIHTFPIDDPPAKFLRCTEKLYVSDHTTKSGFPRSHPNNRSARCIGKVVTDFTTLRDEGKIPIVRPEGAPPYYKIEYDIIPFLHKMALEYKVRWPVDGTGEILSTGQVCIAAAFKPGRG